ncbi:hypothetical protein IC757_14570 [Wenzhouxiangella sp. AB-CW3]|uniref:hypothetical protein n=1 Tax=Wenzhouxiangella sp. AB-CW3 TaxID=2771012 RepID=UPI00168BA63C|nr:hypothetical protein [Wenzhouxiangella sp. AB-CW3]QOC22224.1 hypothetical protein IC757_14570 [Wenzhouxiangella sp. AB-CW3]
MARDNGLGVALHRSSWEIFNRTENPGLLERAVIRVLFHLGGNGVVGMWLLKHA